MPVERFEGPGNSPESQPEKSGGYTPPPDQTILAPTERGSERFIKDGLPSGSPPRYAD